MYRDADQREFARRLRNGMTSAERRLWKVLRAEQLNGLKFRRQAAIGAYVVDFVGFSHKLVIELDGPDHSLDASQVHDAIRTRWLESEGFQVIRFLNYELDEELRCVVAKILGVLAVGSIPLHTPSPTLPTRGRGPERLTGDAAT